MRERLTSIKTRLAAVAKKLRARLFKRGDTLPVIRKLRRRLTGVFLGITGLILAVVMVFGFRFSKNQMESAMQASFNSEAINAVYEIVYNQDEDAIKESLATLERSSNSIVYASVAGEPIEFEYQTEAESDREELYWTALETVYSEEVTWGESSTIMGIMILDEDSVAVAEDIGEAEDEYTLPAEVPLGGLAVKEESTITGEDTEWEDGLPKSGYSAEPTQSFDEFYEIWPGNNLIVTERGTAVVVGEANDYTAIGGVEAESTADSEVVEAGEAMGVTVNVSGEYVFSKAHTDDMVVRGEQGEAYRVVYVDMLYEDNENAAQDKFYELVMLQPYNANQGDYVALVLGYALLFLAGLVVLAGISYLMARLVTKPTAKSLVEQAEFIAAASHELKSPLTVMRTSLSAARVAESETESDKYQTNAEREAERMSRLVEDLLLLAGGDAGSWKLQTETVDMDTLLIELDEHFGPVAKRAVNTLLLRLPDEPLGAVRGDGDRLRQILSVLLDNALQYAPTGTGVVLAAKRRKGRVTVDVIDHGEGIPDADKERVFERFYRADASRSDKSHFGLGLSVARELAELHGGSLTLRDTDGGGATFRLSLPAAEG